MKLTFATIISAFVCISGCAITPWPHTANATPHVRGSIEDAGKPLPNALVRVATGTNEDPCAGKAVEATTGSDGVFEVEPVKELQLFLVMMAHAFIPWNLCYKDDGEWVLLTSVEEYALVDTGPVGVQVVRCDLRSTTNNRCEITWKED